MKPRQRGGGFSFLLKCKLIFIIHQMPEGTNFHGDFTEIFTDVGVTWVAKMQYILLREKNECENKINILYQCF